MRVGFQLNKSSYAMFFKMGEKDLMCLFNNWGQPIASAFAKNVFVQFPYDDFDEFCKKVDSRETFSVSNPRSMMKEILICALTKLDKIEVVH